MSLFKKLFQGDLVNWFIVKKLTKIYDPIIYSSVGGNRIKLNLSHSLPSFLISFPYYDRVLPRICQILNESKPLLKIIDVGANVGDTVAMISEKANANYLCVEGNEKYYDLLVENSMLFTGCVETEKCFLGDKTTKVNMDLITKNGTARLDSGGNSKIFLIKKLDDLLNEKPNFKNNVDLIKIDTDGFELQILRGSKKTIVRNKPLIFFEFTPELMLAQKQDPLDIFKFLSNLGYSDSIFYSNTGVFIDSAKLNDIPKLKELVNRIDGSLIYYYDVLAVHKSCKVVFNKLYLSERSFFRKVNLS
jgi:FkbM family methyltransferase